ncbi:MAG: thiosulfate reductase, partial [Desulfobacterales bacterium]|nr:thiosulfate reductase [Desulfobacterales bacterium]
KADWEIISGLARRMDLPDLVFDTVEDLWNFQLDGTGVSIDDLAQKGMVTLADKPRYLDFDDYKFGTESGKIEIISKKWEDAGVPSLLPYESPAKPGEGEYSLTFGRCALHTQGHTVNNALLNEQMSINPVWIHTDEAAKLGIKEGDTVYVTKDGHTESSIAKVTDMIHPEAVFVIHGFGHRLPVESRAFGKGLSDQHLMQGGLEIWDKAGGAIAYQEHFVTVSKTKP